MSNAVGILALGLAAQGGGGGGSEPSAYIKSASVADNELTLTRKDNTTLTYSPDVDKAYVDQAIEDVEAEIPSLDGYATEDYVDSAVSGKQDVLTAGEGISLVDDEVGVDFNIVATTNYVDNHHDSTKQDKLTAGTNITIDENNVISASGGGGGTSNYNDLTNKPSINNVVLSGDKPLSEFGIQEKLTAGDNITIDVNNVISASGGGSEVSGTNDGTNWTSITIDDDTYAIPSGGGSSWDLSDRIFADASPGTLKLGNNKASVSGNYGLAIGTGNADYSHNVTGTAAIAAGFASGYSRAIQSLGVASVAIGDSLYSQGITASGNGSLAQGFSEGKYGITAGVQGSGFGSIACGCVEAGNTGLSESIGVVSSQGNASYARGYAPRNASLSECSKAYGNCSTSIGTGVKAVDAYSVALGKFQDNTNTSFAINVGNGVDNTNRGNAFQLDWSGNGVFAGTVTPTGADYCEYFEWKDGNPDNEDRMGYLVTLDENKLVLADADDDIVGITSGTKAIIGDSAEMNWEGKYLKDELGRNIYEDYDIEHPAVIDPETGKIIIPAWTEHIHTRKVNPEWDPDRPYTPRSKRKEWYPVGLLGKLYVRDDGTAVVNGYVTANNGIATMSAEKTNLRVLERVNDHIIRVLVK